jgi:hypothetical protein
VINQGVIDLKINKADGKFPLDATLEHLLFTITSSPDLALVLSLSFSLSLSLSVSLSPRGVNYDEI